MKKNITGMALLAVASASGASLQVADYCDVKISAPATVKEMTPMPDGESYAAINDDETAIELFSFKTGKKTGELFSLKGVKGDVKIDSFDGYEVSDDGRRVLLWNSQEKIYRHSFRAEYYVYDVGRQTMKRVSTQGKQRGAVMSHDGLKVAYVRDNNVFISNLDYGTDRAITEDGKPNSIINGSPDWGYEEEFGMLNTLCWSGDDNVLAYLRFDESNVPAYSFDAYRSYCDSDPLGDPYPSQYTYKYSLAGYPVSIVSAHAYDLNTRATKKMDLPMGEKDYIPSIEFDGKGQNLMIMVLNHDQNNLRLLKVNPGSTIAHELVNEKSEGGWLAPDTYQMVKYYDTFFVMASERTGYRHLYRYNYDGAEQGALTKGDFNVTDFYGYDPVKQLYYAQTTSLGPINRSVASVDARGALRLLTGEEGTESALWSKGFKYWLRQWSDAATPPVYSLCDPTGKSLVTVEDNAAYKAKYATAPKVEFLKVKNDAGQEMNAYMIKPAEFDPSRKYPVLMYQYNGPDSQEVVNKWKLDGIFYLSSCGYIVCAVDGRGTGCRDRKWAYAVYKDLGNIEVQDQIAGAKYFASLPYVDGSRIGCFGWSYGGYMTLKELQRAGNPFKCGVAMAAVTDWRFYDSIYTERYMLTPQQNEKGYESSSALNGSRSLSVPLLLMSGTSDDNVHFYNTLKYSSKVTSEGKVIDMMVFTGFDHSLRRCNAREMLYLKVAQFLKGNL